MITIKNITWSNWFSYGENNSLNLEEYKVTQIVGKNGTGKSSIPVIIGEILYGKNNLGKTKQKIFNRYLDKATVAATLEFTKDEDEYLIDFSRKTTIKLLLLKNGEDISSHSATNTYKTIQDILGYDFKTFWGLIYQSSKDGLEFLTATDTHRKKFLINLFNLGLYLQIHENFKKLANEKNVAIQVLKGKLNTIESWISKHSDEDLNEKHLKPLPEMDKNAIDKLSDLKLNLLNIKETNKRINDNEQFKSILKDLNTTILTESIIIPNNKTELWNKSQETRKTLIELKSIIQILSKEIAHISSIPDQCPVCFQATDIRFKKDYISKREQDILEHQKDVDKLEKEITTLTKALEDIKVLEARRDYKEKVEKELQELLIKIDETLPTEVIIESELQTEIKNLTDKITELQNSINSIANENAEKSAHNSKVSVIKSQLAEYKDSLKTISDTVVESEELQSNLEIIKKVFGTNGLVSYKIENLSKDLESQINQYLAELSKGRFQLCFTILGDKLNIEIIDDGSSITIEELSAGELARVNTATLLAIRKLMAAISSTKINILFLDEITGVLDEEGKEVLIDILTQETELNTFLVSHEFSHPLVPRISIIKENKISRIENG